MKISAKPIKFKKYYNAVRYLEGLGNISASYQKTNLKSHPRPEMFLERMRDLLDEIGNPEKGFKYVHITGTAGKGSVSSMVQARLAASGKRTGLFMSPFVVSTIEKIQVDAEYIDPLVFAELTEYIKPAVNRLMISSRHGVPSYFEMILAIALLYFKREQCEYVVLEVGLGGRYDATNVIEKPIIAAITNIGLDHTQILGKTRSDIARDKSGIIKKDCVFFTTEEDPKILGIFKKQCSAVTATYNPLPVNGLSYEKRNHLLATSICRHLGIVEKPSGFSVPPTLPGRFEMVERKPRVIIDGAHNPSKILSTIHNLGKLKYGKLTIVIAISADKDWKTMMRLIVPQGHEVFVTRFGFPGRQSVNPKSLLLEGEKYLGKKASIKLFTDPLQAYVEARKKLAPRDLLLITGSFFLAGDIRALYCPEEQILEQRNSEIDV